MKFERSKEYQQRLFELALFDEKHIITDATIQIVYGTGKKLKAWCEESNTYLQFPRKLRADYDDHGKMFIADVVEVMRKDNIQKYYRAVKNSIREFGSDEVVA